MKSDEKVTAVDAIELFNKETGEVFELPDFLKLPEKGKTVFSGTPLDLRAMLKDHSGHFSIKGVTDQGKTLDGFLLNSRKIVARPSASYRQPTEFCQHIMFAKVGDYYTIVCVTYGGVSAQTADDFVSLLDYNGGRLANMVKVTIEGTTNKHNDKFSVARFSNRPATKEEIERMAQAVTQWPNALTQFNELPNIDAPKNA